MSRESDDGIFSFLLGLTLGMVGGGIVAVLFAPKAGDETRKDVREFIEALPDRIDGEMEPYSKSRQFIDRTRANIENRVDKISKERKAKNMAEAKRREEAASGFEYQ